MSWTDKKALETFKKLRDVYSIEMFVETGTFKGVNAAVHAHNFKTVITTEVCKSYYYEAKRRLSEYTNVFQVLQSSSDFIRDAAQYLTYTSAPIFFYLDAHFYDPTLPIEERFVVLKELRALYEGGYHNVVIAIHDFNCNGLGGLVYDGIPLDFDLVRVPLEEINPNFSYYFNTKDGCDILTQDRVLNREVPGLELDYVTTDNLAYTWSAPSKTYRGILYVTPTPLDLTQFELVEHYA